MGELHEVAKGKLRSRYLCCMCKPTKDLRAEDWLRALANPRSLLPQTPQMLFLAMANLRSHASFLSAYFSSPFSSFLGTQFILQKVGRMRIAARHRVRCLFWGEIA